MLPFLIDYPISQKRLEKVISFLVSNLDYVYDTGKESVLLLLDPVFHLFFCFAFVNSPPSSFPRPPIYKLLRKFPEDVVTEHAELLFVTLVRLTSNYQTPHVLELAGMVTKTLLGRLSANLLGRLHDMTVAWLQHDNLALKRSALQVSLAPSSLVYSEFRLNSLPGLRLLFGGDAGCVRESATGVPRNHCQYHHHHRG